MGVVIKVKTELVIHALWFARWLIPPVFEALAQQEKAERVDATCDVGLFSAWLVTGYTGMTCSSRCELAGRPSRTQLWVLFLHTSHPMVGAPYQRGMGMIQADVKSS